MDVTVSGSWVLNSVTDVGAEATAKKLWSVALVAVTVHVPAVLLDRVYGGEALIAQPEAVPSTVAKVTAPVPEPPEVVKLNGDPNGPDVDVTVTGA